VAESAGRRSSRSDAEQSRDDSSAFRAGIQAPCFRYGAFVGDRPGDMSPPDLGVDAAP
jgi:hypothetical protein